MVKILDHRKEEEGEPYPVHEKADIYCCNDVKIPVFGLLKMRDEMLEITHGIDIVL
jgi:hypothetical protein